MANFPASLDSIANPTSTTLEDASGFSHAGQHTIVNDIAEALEVKVGISESSAQDSPLANTVLQSLTNGKSKWASVPTTALAANAISQIRHAVGTTNNYTATGNNTYTSLPEMTATLTTTGGDVLVFMSASISNSVVANVGIALSLDGAAEVAISEGTAAVATVAVPLSLVWRFSGLSAASHTIVGRMRGAGSGTVGAYLTSRQMLVVELKR